MTNVFGKQLYLFRYPTPQNRTLPVPFLDSLEKIFRVRNIHRSPISVGFLSLTVFPLRCSLSDLVARVSFLLLISKVGIPPSSITFVASRLTINFKVLARL